MGRISSERFGETDVSFFFFSGVLDHEIGWKQCFGDLFCEEVVWDVAGCTKLSKLETSADFGGKFLLILRERIWAYGEGACVGRVLGRSSLLDWG